jgi:hypothetical protein
MLTKGMYGEMYCEGSRDRRIGRRDGLPDN